MEVVGGEAGRNEVECIEMVYFGHGAGAYCVVGGLAGIGCNYCEGLGAD